MSAEKTEQGALEQRLKRLEALFVVLFAHGGEWPEDERFLREVICHMGHLPDSAFFEEMLHLVFRRRPRGRLAELEEEIAQVRQLTATNQATLHEHLSLALLGAETDDIPMRRIVPIRLYLKNEEPKLRELLAEVVSGFAASLGLTVSDDLPLEKGAGFRKWFARTVGPTRQHELRAQLAEGVRALELHALQDPDGARDPARAQATAALVTALGRTGEATLQVGSILLVKSSTGWVTQTLTATELLHLEKHPDVLKTAEATLSFLRAEPPREKTSHRQAHSPIA